jgi:hypothetical protein
MARFCGRIPKYYELQFDKTFTVFNVISEVKQKWDLPSITAGSHGKSLKPFCLHHHTCTSPSTLVTSTNDHSSRTMFAISSTK